MNDWKSSEINELAAALVEAQRVMQPAVKDRTNPHFKSKYADLAGVWEAMGDALQANGLALVQLPCPSERGITLATVLMHKSGQWVRSDLPLDCDLANPQKVGSAITYGRRYGASAMVGVYQDDDDAEAALAGHREPAPASNGGPARDGNAPARDYGPPTNGKSLYAWAKGAGEKFDVNLVRWLDRWGQSKNLPAKFSEWSSEEIKAGHAAAAAKLATIGAPPAGKGEAYEGDLN